MPERPFVKNTGRHNPHLNALQGTSRLPVRRAGPHRQAHMAPYALLGPIAPDGEFHEAKANGLLSTLLIFIENRRSEVMPGRVSRRGNVTPASSGRVDGPAACTARRGPDGVRGVMDFCEPAKIHDIPGLPTGDITSRQRPAGWKRKFHFYRYNHKREWTRYQGFSLPLGHDSEGVVKQRAVILSTLAAERKGWRE